jgi:hypothetical protein
MRLTGVQPRGLQIYRTGGSTMPSRFAGRPAVRQNMPLKMARPGPGGKGRSAPLCAGQALAAVVHSNSAARQRLSCRTWCTLPSCPSPGARCRPAGGQRRQLRCDGRVRWSNRSAAASGSRLPKHLKLYLNELYRVGGLE